MNDAPEERRFASREDLTTALASRVVADVEDAVAARGAASLVLSGGTTPGPLYERLARTPAPWNRVSVTLADERWVAADDPRSNERLIRQTLLQGDAASARFTPMKTADATPEAAEPAVDASLRALPRPFDLVLLGLGENSHTASLFPHGEGLARALDVTDPALARAIRPVPPDDPHPPRLSLTLRALLDSRRIALLFTGEAKWAVYRKSLAAGDIEATPVRAVLAQTQVPVEVWWAP